MQRRFLVSVALVVAYMLLPGLASAQEIGVCTIDQITPTLEPLDFASGRGNSDWGGAATFTVPFPCVLTAVGLMVNATGNPTDGLYVFVENNSSGQPSGTPLDVGSTIPTSGYTSSFDYATSTFSGGITLSPSTTYWVVVGRVSTMTDNSNYINWGGVSGAGGAPAYYQDTTFVSYSPYTVYLEVEGCIADCSEGGGGTGTTTTPVNGLGAAFVTQLGFYMIFFMEMMLIFIPAYTVLWMYRYITGRGLARKGNKSKHG